MENKFQLLIDEIQKSADIVSIIQEYVSLKKAGKNYKALCPFHSEKTPSFIVSPEKQLFHCFGCGEGGNVFTFVQKMEKINFTEAAKQLAAKVGVAWQDKDYQATLQDKLFEINSVACKWFQKNLKNNEAYNYLIRERKLNDEIIEKFKLGYSPPATNTLFNLLKDKFSQDEIEKSGLIVKRKDNYYCIFNNRIIFPIFDIGGRIVGFSGRAIGNIEPKYLNTPETQIFHKRKILYNLNFAKYSISEKNYAIIVEGYMDVISLVKEGILNCVASMGTSLTEEQIKHLQKFTTRVITCFDPDAAGSAATDRIIDALSQENFKVFVVSLPHNKDPDVLVQEVGGKKFQEILRKAKPYIKYKIDKIIKSKKNYTPEDKAEILNKVIHILRKIKSTVILDSYIKIISQQLDVDEKVIRLNPYLQNFHPSNTKSTFQKQPITQDRIEQEFLRILLSNISCVDNIKDKISPSDFLSPCGKIFEIILKHYKTSSNDNLYLRVHNELSDDLKKYFTTLACQKELTIKNQDDINNWILNIKAQSLRKKIKKIREEIKIAEKEKNIEKSLSLAKECLNLEMTLRNLKM